MQTKGFAQLVQTKLMASTFVHQKIGKTWWRNLCQFTVFSNWANEMRLRKAWTSEICQAAAGGWDSCSFTLGRGRPSNMLGGGRAVRLNWKNRSTYPDKSPDSLGCHFYIVQLIFLCNLFINCKNSIESEWGMASHPIQPHLLDPQSSLNSWFTLLSINLCHFREPHVVANSNPYFTQSCQQNNNIIFTKWI